MSAVATVSGKLADFIHDTTFRDLPASTMEKAKIRLLDCLGTALAARGLHVPGVALAFVRGGQRGAGQRDRACGAPAGDRCGIRERDAR